MSGKGYRFTGMMTANGLVSIGDTSGGDEHEAFIRVDDVASFNVDWSVESGQIKIITRLGGHYEITFDDGDAGQACADAISDLHQAMRTPVPVDG